MASRSGDLYNKRKSLWVSLALTLFVSLVAVAIWLPVSVGAFHHDHTGNRTHHGYIHFKYGDGNSYGSSDEAFCVQSHTSYISYDEASRRVIDTVYTSPTWDGTGGWRIDLWRTRSSCNSYSDKSWIDIEIHVYKNNAGNCVEDRSCVKHYNPYWSSTYGHYHFRYEWLFLDYDNIPKEDATKYRRAINHELGHVWGLRDKGDGGDNTCQESIMHNIYYDCSYNSSYPSQGDFGTVVHIMDER